MNLAAYNAYTADICWRRSQAEHVPFKKVSIGNWSPGVAQCHENVDAWVTGNPDCIAVRGWVTFADFMIAVGLSAHSVVRDSHGRLFDITPLENEDLGKGMRFVPHIGDEQVFFEAKERNIEIRCARGDG